LYKEELPGTRALEFFAESSWNFKALRKPTR